MKVQVIVLTTLDHTRLILALNSRGSVYAGTADPKAVTRRRKHRKMRRATRQAQRAAS